MKKITTYLLLFTSLLTFGQWNQLGNSINGTVANDRLGSTHAVAIDANGTTIVVGSAYNSPGYAKVLDWNGISWLQRGTSIIGNNTTYEGTGSAVDISANGMTVAVSSPWGYNSLGYKCGNVRVFDWVANTWIQRGLNIDGEGNPSPTLSGDVFGTALQLSADGNFIVVGARGNTAQAGVNQLSGHARVYHWNGSSWVQIGQDIDCPISLGTDEFGYAVSINDAGNRIAVGARYYTGAVAADQHKGMAIALEFNGINWVSMGNALFGETTNDQLGTAVQMSSDGNTMVVGASRANGFSGVTKAFDWNGTTWIQRGANLDGLNTARSGSSIGLSNDGTIVALGEPSVSGYGGTARIFQWNGTNWQQLDSTISLPSFDVVGFGAAVRLNASGSKIIIGIPFNDDGGNNSGKVRVYENLSILGNSNIKEQEHLIAYPNPTDNYIQIKSEFDILSYTLLSMDGKTILTNKFGVEKEFMINLSNLNSGVYLLKLQSIDKTSNLQIIKK